MTAPGLLQMIYSQAEGQKTERFGEDESTWLARVDTIVPERLPAFEEVRDTLVTAWKQQQQAESEVVAAIKASLQETRRKHNAWYRLRNGMRR